MLAGCAEWSRWGVERSVRAAKGHFLAQQKGLLLPRSAQKVGLEGKISAEFAREFSYSLRVGRSTAITKCAKFDAPSSSWSHRATQCSAKYFETRVSGIPKCSARRGLIESAPRRLAPPRKRLPIAIRSVWHPSTHYYPLQSAPSPPKTPHPPS